MKSRFIFHWFLLLTFCASLLGPVAGASAQPSSQTTAAERVLFSMTPEERVGQLFLVTFGGTNTGSESQIYDLIVNQHVGGVVLLADNDNFVAAPDTLTSVHQLINNLQSLEWDATALGLNEQSPRSVYVPLFIGISQEGDGPPHDQILSGLTPLPAAMAIGATWKPELARQVGSVVGSELSALGFNLFLGPSLDVVEAPDPAARSDLGTRVFGGHPYWVGVMGRAYVSGLHEGSKNRMVVVAKHFPGRGSSDRLPEEEVATVRKGLEQLKQVELSPFFAVTNAAEPAGLVDGLLVPHIRYQAFQGNIRATTRPVSFDASALPKILALPEFTVWRADGGLIVSDSLGSEAVRQFFSQQGTANFSPRLVARDAFLAGNDISYLGNIKSDPDIGDTYSATLEILQFFAQEYRNDLVFAQRVDTAVLRILEKKLSMYGTFNVSNVRSETLDTTKIGSSQQVMFDVARNSATLINVDPQELGTLLPQSPNLSDRIVFLTDTSSYEQCSSCPFRDTLAVDDLHKNVVRIYGQSGSAQILTNRLNSYPLSELGPMLKGESETDIEEVLGRATWIVISLADVNGGQLTLLRRLFSERPDLVRNRNIILFSFTAPYYLDATDISKLTAYYALYSKQPAFVDVAARLLFQQVPLQGASPVSIPAVEYDLLVETSPDPAQVIPLALEQVETAKPLEGTLTPQPTPSPEPYKIGDTIAVRAGPVMDRNNHIVPDGTVVQFTMSTRDESGGILRQVEATTTDGIAHATFVIDKPGSVEISVVSEPALISNVLQFIASTERVVVVTVVPSALPTITPIPPTPTPVPTQIPWITSEGYPRVGGWFLTLLALFGTAGLAFWAVSKIISVRWGLRWAFCMLIGGLLGYNYLALDLPGAAEWITGTAGAGGLLVLTFAGEIIGAILALAWMFWFSAPRSQAD
ncbi:MAG TPA: glycoside hydrolase family 3 N-terminal domain-containing protein [Anaerolineales bacterium]|nr:glycoside hydrolase family 3 N-terminal domain-containing protein [Anaerolineales bacterium]